MGASSPLYVPADGTSQAIIVVKLLDADGNFVSGKSITLAANGGSSASILPTSGVTDSNSGAAAFTVTDLTPQAVTLTAADATDGITLTEQPVVTFGVPLAVSASIAASLSNEPADGLTADTITVTLEDSLGRPTPGKVVTLSQGAAFSSINSPSPSVTDSNGQIQFAVTDIHTENVTYTATDVTDGNLPVPGTAAVDFTSGTGGCNSASYVTGTANSAPGYAVSAFASGFVVSGGNQGFSYNCLGAYGMAWDAADNLYVTDWPTGKIYKFGPSGGPADASHLFTTVKAPATGVAIDSAGNMFASEGSVSGANGDIVPVNLASGAVGTAIASGLECVSALALNPSIPALFADDFCSSGTGGNLNIWEVTGIDGPSPSTTVYAQLPSTDQESFEISVAPDGNLYTAFATGSGIEIARISNASPPVVSTLTGADGNPIIVQYGTDLTAGGMQSSGDFQFLLGGFVPTSGAATGGVQTLDLTGSPPTLAVQLTTSEFSGLASAAIGPDGCLYVAGGPTVSRVTKSDGGCGFGPTTQQPTIALTPTSVSPNPAQGSQQSFTATLHYAALGAGTPITLTTSGANPRIVLADTDSSGQATFSYTGVLPGLDNVSASAIVNSTFVSSNPVQVDWQPGLDSTFVSLNLSPTSATPGQSVTLAANLVDVSAQPATAVADETIDFTLGGGGCSAVTDSTGNATCVTTAPTTPGIETLSASFAGTNSLVASNASKGFTVVAQAATPTATPTPVAGALRIAPKHLNFGAVDTGASKTKTVKITNAGVINKKKHAVPILIEMETATPSAFQVTKTCAEDLDPRAKGVKPGTCEVSVTFAPTQATDYSGNLVITDNLEPSFSAIVPVRGKGKVPK